MRLRTSTATLTSVTRHSPYVSAARHRSPVSIARSGRWRHPHRDATSATTGASWCHASRPAIRPHRTASGRCCPPASAGAASPVPMVLGCGRGTASVAEPQLSVVWSGTRRVRTSRLMIEPIRPSACQRRIPGLATARREWWRCPRRDRLVGKPHGQAAAPTQADLVGGPVRDLVVLPRDVVAAIIV